jgi:hypothetical protein
VTGPVPTRPEQRQQEVLLPAPAAPLGVEVANGRLIPMVTAGVFYDDNVFARPTARLSDTAWFVRPEILWLSTNPRGQVAAGAFVEAREYRRFHTEDQVNGAAYIGGSHLIDDNTQIVGRAAYTRAHEDRGVSESSLTEFRRPLGYHQVEAAGALNKRYGGGWWTSVGGAALWLNYDDDAVTLAGVPVSLLYRDGTVVWVPGRIGKVVAANTSVFLEVAGNRRDWKVDTFDSRGYRVVGGILLEPGPGARVRGEAFAGYMHQDYEGATFLTISTWTVGASLAFLLMPNVTAVVEARRDAKESGLSPTGLATDGVSLIETLVSGRIDVQVIQNVVIGVGVSYLEDDFQGVGRTDSSVSPLASLRWFATRNLTFGLDYRHLDFDSNATLGYRRNVFMASVHGRF